MNCSSIWILLQERASEQRHTQQAPPFTHRDRRTQHREQYPRVDRMPHEAIWPAADQFVVLLQRDQPAPVAAEPDASKNAKAKPDRHQRKAQPEQQRCTRQVAHRQIGAGQTRRHHDADAKQQRNHVRQLRRDALATPRRLRAETGNAPIDGPDQPQGQDRVIDKLAHCGGGAIRRWALPPGCARTGRNRQATRQD